MRHVDSALEILNDHLHHAGWSQLRDIGHVAQGFVRAKVSYWTCGEGTTAVEFEYLLLSDLKEEVSDTTKDGCGWGAPSGA